MALSLLLHEPKAVIGRQTDKGGSNHGLDTIDHRNSDSPFGSSLHVSYLERATLKPKSHAQERTGINACRHLPQSSLRNGRLWTARPQLSLRIEWPRVFVL